MLLRSTRRHRRHFVRVAGEEGGTEARFIEGRDVGSGAGGGGGPKVGFSFHYMVSHSLAFHW